MHTENRKPINLQHKLAEINIVPSSNVNPLVLKRLVQLALDSYLLSESDIVSADKIHQEAKNRHGDFYDTPGYYVKLYRTRSSMTQQVLADKLQIKQHHLSEIENNKRSVGKELAKKIATVLKFDYRKLL